MYIGEVLDIKKENEKLKEQLAGHKRMEYLAKISLKKLKKIREKCEKYNANVGDTIIANPIQDLYDILQIIKEE